MKQHHYHILLWGVLLPLLFFRCSLSPSATTPIIEGKGGVTYAQGFKMEEREGYTLVEVINPWQRDQLLQRYLLVPRDAPLPENLPSGTLVRTPLQEVVAYSSVYCSMLAYLDALPALVGVCEPQYIAMPELQERLRQGLIANVGEASAPNVEQILELHPQAIFTTPFKDTRYGAIEKTKIPLIECADYMETSPLGRAEWIRFIALFLGESAKADSLFAATEQSYNQLKAVAQGVNHRPTVLTELKTGSTWYVPGGESYMAQFFADAGGRYLWAEDTSSGSLPLSFETVYERAGNADFWFIKYYDPTRPMSYTSLLQEYTLYERFDAYKERTVYGCNTAQIALYEELPLHPDYFLRNIIATLHPHLLPAEEKEEAMRYFKPLQND